MSVCLITAEIQFKVVCCFSHINTGFLTSFKLYIWDFIVINHHETTIPFSEWNLQFVCSQVTQGRSQVSQYRQNALLPKAVIAAVMWLSAHSQCCCGWVYTQTGSLLMPGYHHEDDARANVTTAYSINRLELRDDNLLFGHSLLITLEKVIQLSIFC